MRDVAREAEQVFELLKGHIFLNAEDACEDLGFVYDMDMCAAIDNIGFYCGDCGHWCEAAETADLEAYDGDEWVCDTCYPLED